MTLPPLRHQLVRLLAGLLLANGTALAASEDAILTSVFAKTDPGYKRKKTPEGGWQREYYALSNGGPAAGTVRDNAQEKVQFASLAGVLAEHLARQGYFPATDPAKVDLLIVINWGRTTPFSDSTYRSGTDNVMASMNTVSSLNQAASFRTEGPATDANGVPQAEVSLTGSVEDMQQQAAQSQLDGAMMTQELFNRARQQDNAKNGHLLGYMNEINEADGIQRLAGGGDRYADLVADIEEARYYVIVSAYDFQRTVREKKPKLQWVTRMSMRAPGNSFADKAASMVAYAAARFGRDSDGLERKAHPNFQVKLDEVKFLGEASGAPPPPAPAPGKGK